MLLRHGRFFVVKRDMLSFEVSGVSASPCQLMDPAMRKYRLKAWRHYPSSRRSRSGGLKVHQPVRMTKVRKLVQILADMRKNWKCFPTPLQQAIHSLAAAHPIQYRLKAKEPVRDVAVVEGQEVRYIAPEERSNKQIYLQSRMATV